MLASLAENETEWADKLNTMWRLEWNNYKIPVSYHSQSKDFSEEEIRKCFCRSPGEVSQSQVMEPKQSLGCIQKNQKRMHYETDLPLHLTPVTPEVPKGIQQERRLLTPSRLHWS